MQKLRSNFLQVDLIVVKSLKAVSFISAVAMLIVAVLATIDVIMAKVFRSGVPNATEIIKYLLIPIVYSACAYLAIDQGLINVDLIQGRFPRAMRIAVNILSDLLGLASSAFLAWRGWIQFFKLLQSGEKSSSSSYAFVVWPFGLMFFIGMALLAVALLWRLMRDFICPELNEAKKEDGGEIA